ncbi:histidine kinase [Croceivirga lutea]|uniref:sensor histidine kinase n=1 Tax=Croceivirga lutea TaxID=1775167 RepID=UPI00163A2B4D|nr:histidine kinase [Croceivirga lutea]GGG52607.1 histidine kinase [Croceivirga lutea]
MITKKEVLFQILLHLVILLFFGYNWQTETYSLDRVVFFVMYALGTLTITYFFMPNFLYKKKYWQFFVGLIGVISALILLEEFVLEQIFYPDTKRSGTFPGIFISLIGVLPIMTILASGKFAWDALGRQRQIEDLKSSIQESELQFLRSQVNPHFLFNNLNNLYSYALEGSTKTPEIILELSGVLRYMLYECKEEFVPLDKELEQLGNFIRLYKMQIEERGVVNFKVNSINSGYKIAPLILVVFIENAFKHSQSGQSSDIKIDINLDMNGSTLNFSCKNNYEKTQGLETVAKGIGLTNVKKRLELLYAKKYQLKIDEKGNTFEVNLSLDLERA